MDINKIEKGNEYTVVQQAMEQIRNLIIAGHYKPGDRLPTETELASRFGISRSSLREAIKLFNYLGVLESRVAKGTFISDGSNISAEALSLAALLGNKNIDELLEYINCQLLWCSLSLADAYKNNSDEYKSYITSLEDELVRYKIACDIGNIASIDNCIYKILTIITSSTKNNVFILMLKTLHMFASNINIKVQVNLYSQNQVTYNVYSALVTAIKEHDLPSLYHVVSDLLSIEKDRMSMPLPPPFAI